MKTLLTTTAFILAFLSYSTAQGNLQFNQVINATTTPINYNYDTEVLGTIVVPAGKVLKIESTSFTYINSTETYYINNSVYIDRLIAWSGSSDVRHYLPLWLSEGTYQISAYGSSQTDAAFSYSAIEFNIIP